MKIAWTRPKWFTLGNNLKREIYAEIILFSIVDTIQVLF